MRPNRLAMLYCGAMKNPHAVALGRKGGQSTSPEKVAAARDNGRKGGRKKRVDKPKRLA